MQGDCTAGLSLKINYELGCHTCLRHPNGEGSYIPTFPRVCFVLREKLASGLERRGHKAHILIQGKQGESLNSFERRMWIFGGGKQHGTRTIYEPLLEDLPAWWIIGK